MSRAKVILMALALSAGSIAEVPLATPAVAAENTAVTDSHTIDTSDQHEVAAAYRERLSLVSGVENETSADVANCDPGVQSPAARQAMITTVNYYRAMAGLPAVEEHEELNSRTQQVALMLAANNQLSYSPPTGWNCYTTEGAEDARWSLQAQTSTGKPADAVKLWMASESDTAVTLRRWLLYPPTTRTGTGGVGQYLAYYFAADWGGARPSGPEWVAWPPAGYVPWGALETFGGGHISRWSLSSNEYPDANYSAAQVSMTYDGQTVQATEESPESFRGDATLVWPAPNLTPDSGITEVTVNVTGMKTAGGAAIPDHSYGVRVFDPQPPAPVEALAITGRIGSAHVAWQNPDAEDLAGVEVRYAPGPVPPARGEGSLGCSVLAPATSCTVSGLAAGPYAFAVFARDQAGNYSLASNEQVGSTAMDSSARPSALVYGAATSLTGRLTSGAYGVPAATLAVQTRAKRADGTWTRWTAAGSVVTATSPTAGTYATSRKPARTLQYRLVYAGGPGRLGVRGNAITVSVAPRITSALSKTKMSLGSRAVLSGAVGPNLAGRVATVQQRRGSGSWRKLGTTKLTTSSTYRFVVRPGVKAVWSYRVVLPPTAAHAAGVSPVRKVTVF